MEYFDIEEVSSKILHELLQYRRRFPESEHTIQYEENKVSEVQLPRIRAFVEQGKPIECILPAFPTKSPNPRKVLGKMPDMAEKLSLMFLNSLCQRIQLYYPPGAKIIICSDGHVFSDLIHVDDNTITDYQVEIEKLLHESGATHLSVFNLGNVESLTQYTDDYDQLRELLVKNYASSTEEIKAILKENEEGLLLYRAITRFLYEDSLLPEYTGSKNALQKDARQRSVGVIQRSWAWGNLLAEQFPQAIRLSIHPQSVESLKLGIHMMPTRDDWLTPWHGVAANINGQFVLMKSDEVKNLQGKLIHIRGVPSHYVIETESERNQEIEPIAEAVHAG
ncbi:L-tyrosine/L-tryptophan isonitrile synthase family protein [Xenorhabdus nematophila]|uniref:L-tyrosine isonitrile synthase n=1 Tax=Xenorhabdus nematophila (strain ATCC 19061 / DSM 3370 / CCUG 14189 / LMG 1036 / NCIMB 9965 / AN6) TaxID=406817 RepID=PVCA_XENNA|nr:L-tyrosine isonitrile synthase [Xenorhabdus nematophila]D3V9Q4.1 RecName: Full=L-tyrosine isonitrile synthase; AltName: Full=Rhabduscin biosynthesis protein PvcA [Xenorhabdus nematophila ATCC 19061]CEE95006.1 Isocyanide synthesiszing protein IsnA involved in rhabduscin biosynthesis [Xenorhabdus nematophila str. Anatoliense]CEF29268.1 Isocyanide synthesiszing protein IsnA involved in rhabduscin biosynthesis [Xenorhabdus nematophila str. Websteri]AYA39529.1 paerucumarin biosynthesis protein Pv